MPTATETGIIRPARAEDVPAILELINGSPEQLLPRSHPDIEALLETFWVADVAGRVVGCCCLEVYSPKIAEVRSLAVHPDARGLRYGARLVATAVAEARRRDIPQVLVVTSNVEFFARQHFEPCLNEKYALFWKDPNASPQA